VNSRAKEISFVEAKMSQARWLIVAVVGLVIGTSWVFRLTHPVDAMLSDAEWSIRLGKTDALAAHTGSLGASLSAHPEACVNLAWKLSKLGKNSTAAKLLEGAWQANPFASSLPEALASILMTEGDFAAAGSVFERMRERGLSLSPAEIEIEAGLFTRTEKFAEAKDVLQNLIARDPHNISALVQLGNICNAQQNFTEAVAAFRRALALDGTAREIRLALARALSWEAMQAAQQSLQPARIASHE
jgi:tetratricopeptide (TPR) repeat protein